MDIIFTLSPSLTELSLFLFWSYCSSQSNKSQSTGIWFIQWNPVRFNWFLFKLVQLELLGSYSEVLWCLVFKLILMWSSCFYLWSRPISHPILKVLSSPVTDQPLAQVCKQFVKYIVIPVNAQNHSISTEISSSAAKDELFYKQPNCYVMITSPWTFLPRAHHIAVFSIIRSIGN